MLSPQNIYQMALLSTVLVINGVLAQIQTNFPSIDFGEQGNRQGRSNIGQEVENRYSRGSSDGGEFTKIVVVGVIVLASAVAVALFFYRARFMTPKLKDVELKDDGIRRYSIPRVQNAKVNPKHDSLLEQEDFELSKFGIETIVVEQSFNTLDSDPRSRGSVIYDRTISNPRDSVGLVKNVKRVSFSPADLPELKSEPSVPPSALKKPEVLPSALKKTGNQYSYLNQPHSSSYEGSLPEKGKRPSLLGLFRKE